MATRRGLRLFFPLPLVAMAALLWPLSNGDSAPQSTGEAAYHALPPRPAGDAERGRAGVERTAIAVAAWLHGVPVAAGSDATCATDRLTVSWTDPPAGAAHGAYVAPLGPVPTDATTAVNGIVLCAGSDYAYMGFQARYVDARWDVVAVPVTEAEEASAPEPAAPLPPTNVTLDGRTFGRDIEAPAAYEPQRTCDATPKVGTVALKNLLLKTYPGSRSLGIGTACDGTVSEHHEGRAFDFGVRVDVPAEKVMAQSFIDTVLAPDQYGNQFALARRMGIMYLIWDHHIWSTYRASEGWRDYHGSSPHTDHIHISMSWAGALGRTSFWSGNVAQQLAGSPPKATAQVASAPRRSSSSPPTTTRRHHDVTIDTQLTADDSAARDAARQQAIDAWKARRDAERQRRRDASSTTTTTWEPRPTTSTTWVPRPTTSTTWVPRPTTSTTAPVPRPPTTWRPRPPTTTTTAPRPTTTTTVAASVDPPRPADHHRHQRPPSTTTSTSTAPSPTTTTGGQ